MARVEYERREVAHQYASGRALTDRALDGWRVAVEEFLPADESEQQVLDLGAGTGIFSRAWPMWRRCQVIAVEPSEAMRTEMVRNGLPDRVHVVGAVAENLPLQNGFMDVAWLSAVVHHFADLEQSAQELRRVLHSGGVLLIRGLFADSAVPSGLRHLPGCQRALSSFPSTERLDALLHEAGFKLIGRREVADHGPSTIAEASDWIRRSRQADTFLLSLTDDEIQTGLAIMRSHDQAETLDPSPLSLLAYVAR